MPVQEFLLYAGCPQSASLYEPETVDFPVEQAAAAEVELPVPADYGQLFSSGALRRLLVLDGLQDPGNLVKI